MAEQPQQAFDATQVGPDKYSCVGPMVRTQHGPVSTA